MKTITALAFLMSALTVTACNKKEEPASKPKAGMEVPAPKTEKAAPTEPAKAEPAKAAPAADETDPEEADEPLPGDDLPSGEIEESGDEDMGD